MNNHDFKAARKFLNDDFSSVTPMGSCEVPEQFLEDAAGTNATYEVRKVFSEDDDVCILFDTSMPMLTMFTCGWYHVESGKIDSIKLVFDASPFANMNEREN